MAKSRRRPPVATDKRFRPAAAQPDHGPRERWQHSGRVLELTERAGILAARATEEHVLDGLVLRGLIDDAQRQAGLRLRLDFHRAALTAHVTGSYNPLTRRADPARAAHERSELQEAAYRRWRQALSGLGAILSRPVLATCCDDQWPRPGDIGLLKEGLAKLAKYYRPPVKG